MSNSQNITWNEIPKDIKGKEIFGKNIFTSKTFTEKIDNIVNETIDKDIPEEKLKESIEEYGLGKVIFYFRENKEVLKKIFGEATNIIENGVIKKEIKTKFGEIDPKQIIKDNFINKNDNKYLDEDGNKDFYLIGEDILKKLGDFFEDIVGKVWGKKELEECLIDSSFEENINALKNYSFKENFLDDSLQIVSIENNSFLKKVLFSSLSLAKNSLKVNLKQLKDEKGKEIFSDEILNNETEISKTLFKFLYGEELEIPDIGDVNFLRKNISLANFFDGFGNFKNDYFNINTVVGKKTINIELFFEKLKVNSGKELIKKLYVEEFEELINKESIKNSIGGIQNLLNESGQFAELNKIVKINGININLKSLCFLLGIEEKTVVLIIELYREEIKELNPEYFQKSIGEIGNLLDNSGKFDENKIIDLGENFGKIKLRNIISLLLRVDDRLRNQVISIDVKKYGLNSFILNFVYYVFDKYEIEKIFNDNIASLDKEGLKNLVLDISNLLDYGRELKGTWNLIEQVLAEQNNNHIDTFFSEKTLTVPLSSIFEKLQKKGINIDTKQALAFYLFGEDKVKEYLKNKFEEGKYPSYYEYSEIEKDMLDYIKNNYSIDLVSSNKNVLKEKLQEIFPFKFLANNLQNNLHGIQINKKLNFKVRIGTQNIQKYGQIWNYIVENNFIDLEQKNDKALNSSNIEKLFIFIYGEEAKRTISNEKYLNERKQQELVEKLAKQKAKRLKPEKVVEEKIKEKTKEDIIKDFSEKQEKFLGDGIENFNKDWLEAFGKINELKLDGLKMILEEAGEEIEDLTIEDLKNIEEKTIIEIGEEMFELELIKINFIMNKLKEKLK